MPFVLMRIAPHLLKHSKCKLVPEDIPERSEQLIKNLPSIVAEALSVPGTQGELTAGEIEVKVETFGPLDIHTKDLEIIIWANDYPERKKNLNERRSLILEKVKAMSPATNGFVWVLLQPGSYGEF